MAKVKQKKISGIVYNSTDEKYTPTDFIVAVERSKEGNLLNINNGVTKWSICVNDIKPLLL